MIIYSSSQVATIGAASVAFGAAMAVGQRYLLVADTDLWFKQGASGLTAVANTAGNHLLLAGQVREFLIQDATNYGFIAMIQKSAAGVASLSLIDGVA